MNRAKLELDSGGKMVYFSFLKRKQKGSVLILAYMIISVFIVSSALLLFKAINEKNLSLRNKLNSELFYLVEGGIESAIAAFTSAIANYQITPDAESFNFVTTFNTFDGATVNATITRLEDSDRLVIDGQTNILIRNYEVTATATHPRNSTFTATHHQIIARRLIPTFQHAVFYNDDLEILPGANMSLSGRIHCNKNIYVDAEPGRTLTIDSFYFCSAGNIYNKRKDSNTELDGEVSIRVNEPGVPAYEEMDNLDCDSSNWTDEALARWEGTVRSAAHGVTKMNAPSIASIQPNGYYANQADTVIVNGVLKKGGTTLTEGVDYPVGAITTITTSLYNNRERKYIKTTNVNLKLLAGGTIGGKTYPNNLPSNGLLYATRDNAGAPYEPGIRLVNASEIARAGGLTVVSNDPVYIQGNYNTINEKPTSVICDSLNLLSNNWNDANSTLGLNSRIASNTTFNSAFIAGVDTTTGGHYNGGLENYPRLHEKWTSVQLNIKGSFVELWKNTIATGAWLYGSPQYTAPLRNWSYNTSFNNIANLPPFTPWAVEVQRIAWWKD